MIGYLEAHMMLNQGLTQVQAQKLNLTQSLQQSIQLLQFDAEELDEFLEEASLNNPFLQIRRKSNSLIAQTDFFEQLPMPQKYSLTDYVQEQIKMSWHDTRLRKMLLVLSGSFDDKGYLLARPQELLQQFSPTSVEISDVMTLLSQLDPPGLGARNLQESLALQLERTDNHSPALGLVRNHYEDFIYHRWGKIIQRTNLTSRAIQNAFDSLKTLSPYPAYGFSETQITYVRPSLVIDLSNNELSVSLGVGEQIRVSVNESEVAGYRSSSDSEITRYVGMQMADYHFLEHSLAHRRATILRIGQVLIHKQAAFFITRDQIELHPLSLQDVANELDLNISTISRAIRGKYLQTRFGNYPLKQFFGRSTAHDENLTVADVKSILVDVIASENKTSPYSDIDLEKCLAGKNIKIARRTIAKYREQLAIPTAKQRREIK